LEANLSIIVLIAVLMVNVCLILSKKNGNFHRRDGKNQQSQARTNRETSTPQTQSKHLAAAATSDGTIERYKACLVAKGYTLKALTSTSLPFR